MPHLSVRLFGSIEVTLDGEVVTAFKSDKARALLAYLVVEAQHPHRREKLAGLLWPEWPEQAARGNLRRTLSNLRLAIDDHQATLPFLHISHQTIQFNSASDAWVDVTAFTDLLEAKGDLQQLIGQLEEAVELYRGDFLEGFSIPDSAAFEEWALLNRERFRRLVMVVLHRLARCYEQRSDYESALRHAWRQVELEPWQEEAHQQVMRLLALNGQRGAALAQYESCRRLLAEELGVDPSRETTGLYEQIRNGKLGKGLVTSPLFLVPSPLSLVPSPPFVARERELAQLGGFLDLALAGQGRAVFVTGEAGSGKTALVQEFTRRAQEAHPHLLVASGKCNAHTGIGDPYLPFREILELLTSDVEARWTAGTISRAHTLRLWNALPIVAQALVEVGPDLIDTFVPTAPLMERAVAHAPGEADWLARLEKLSARQAGSRGSRSSGQSSLFEQYTRVLAALARQVPLLLVLDDLQWADAGSICLLFHLGRQLAGSRILIVGAYRPEEVASGRDGKRHPLEPVVNELRRDFGDITVNLDQAEGWDFVEAFLDSEPNRLGLPFREMLYRQTRGHPLFTIELLRGMQERGDLVQNQEGGWVEGLALDWDTLPARVEAVIAERMSRLAEPLQDMLRVASVEGEVFTAEVVAQVRAADEREIVGRLSGQLDRQHRLIRAEGILRTESQYVSQYRFRHILFQRYLYSSLDCVERAHLHEEVGTVLEGLYGERTAEIAVQLAQHFQEAGIAEKAVEYSRQAGERAVRMLANEEAIAHFNQGLELLMTLPDTPERAQRELVLQAGLAVPLQNTRGLGDPEVSRVCARARELCQRVGETPRLFPVLWYLMTFYVSRGEYRTAHEIGEQLLGLARRIGDPLLLAPAHLALGWPLIYLGELAQARVHLERTIALYDPEQHHSLAFLYGMDVGVCALTMVSGVLWLLGYPEQALEQGRKALALAQALSRPSALATAQAGVGTIHTYRRDVQAARELGEECIRLSTEQEFPYWLAVGLYCRGWALTEQGQVEEGIELLRQSMAGAQATGAVVGQTFRLVTLAEAYAKIGQAERGLTFLAEALATAYRNGEQFYEAEIHRLKGDLLLMQDDQAEAEASFNKAIEVARQQSAKSWELRATTSLARLRQKQGKREEARQMLAEVYGWFTEGFDTPDLREAKALLEELS